MTGTRTPPVRSAAGGLFSWASPHERPDGFAAVLDRSARWRCSGSSAPTTGWCACARRPCRPTRRSMPRWCGSSISCRRARPRPSAGRRRGAAARSLQAAAGQLATLLAATRLRAARSGRHRRAGHGAARAARRPGSGCIPTRWRLRRRRHAVATRAARTARRGRCWPASARDRLARAFGRGGNRARPVQPGRGAVQRGDRPVSGVAGGVDHAAAAGGALALTAGAALSPSSPRYHRPKLPDPSDSQLRSPASPPLWRQLQLTAAALASIRGGVSGTVAFEAVDPALRPGVQALGFQVLRWLGRAEALRAPAGQAHAAAGRRCAAAAPRWRCAGAPSDAPYSHTLVDQAVEAAKRNPRTRAQASFVNACCAASCASARRWSRAHRPRAGGAVEPPALVDRAPAARLSARLAARAGGRQRAAADDLRVNTRRPTRRAYLRSARSQRAAGRAGGGAAGVQLHAPRPVHAAAGLCRRRGLGAGRRRAARRAAAARRPGLAARAARVLDACAAPGGKTAHLLELADLD